MPNDFAIFIMVYGRPDKMWTYHTLRKQGYTGKIYLVGDDTDETIEEYKKKYGNELLVFDKKKASLTCDTGDNTGDLRSTLFAVNTIPQLAKENGIHYFMIMCDDYTAFYYNYDENYKFKKNRVKNLDNVLKVMLAYYKSIPCLTIAMAQAGDFIGGYRSPRSEIQLLRKAMNTFLCSVNRPFKFMGRLNEDVTTYCNLGFKGALFLTFTNICMIQKESQSEKSGLTDVYLDNGTYVKSFFSVMYNPSFVYISMMRSKFGRIHHYVDWKYGSPKILNEKYKKENR